MQTGGVVITSVEKQTQLWKTQFETILNKEAPREVEDIPERDEDLLVNMDPPTANEVKSAIDNMKSGKAPGADGVSAEMLKAGGDVITETLTEIFKEIWEEEEIPVDWKTELIVKLPTKGNLSPGLEINFFGGGKPLLPSLKLGSKTNFVDAKF